MVRQTGQEVCSCLQRFKASESKTWKQEVTAKEETSLNGTAVIGQESSVPLAWSIKTFPTCSGMGRGILLSSVGLGGKGGKSRRRGDPRSLFSTVGYTVRTDCVSSSDSAGSGIDSGDLRLGGVGGRIGVEEISSSPSGI
jgi:hypothetical protein